MNSNFYNSSKIAAKSLFISCLFIMISFTFNIANAQNCMLVPVSLNDRVQNSTLIIEGKVISQQSYWGKDKRNIFTRNTVEVYKIFKGIVKTKTIEIVTEGGTIDMNRQVLTSTLTLNVGDMGVWMCTPNSFPDSDGKGYLVYSSLTGFINYDPVEGSANDPFNSYQSIERELFPAIEKITKTAPVDLAPNPSRINGFIKTGSLNNQRGNNPNQLLSTPTITSFTPASVASGTGATITITGTNFNATQGAGFVEFRNADDGGTTWIKPLSTDYVSWNSTSITVKVPSNNTSGFGAGTGQIRVTNSDASPTPVISASTLTVTYAYSNIVSANTARMATHVNANPFGGYTFLLNTSTFASNANAVSKFKQILNTWTCTTGINWLVGSNTTAIAGSDGVCVATFSGSLPGSVLARCVSWYSGCGSSPYDWYVREMDMEVANVPGSGTWYYGTGSPSGTQYDFESVVLHEMGHGHQLNHVIAPTAVMHYAISAGQVKRTLNANEITGAGFIMNRDTTITPVCSTTKMTKMNCNTGTTSAPLVAFTADKTNITTGCIVNFTNQSAPQTTSWSWNFGAAGTSTSENPAVTFNTAGTYTVSLTTTNANGSNSLTKTGYIVVSAYSCSSTTTNFTGSDFDISAPVGKIAGHNGYGDLAFADKFSYCGYTNNLTQLKYNFNKKLGTGNIIARVWSADGTGGSPGTVLFSQTLAISALATYPAVTTVTLPSALAISNDYYIGYQITYAPGDSVSLITTGSNVNPVNTGWRLQSDNSWVSYADSYGIRISEKVYGVFVNTPTATITPAGATTVCSPASVILNANTGSGYSYQWLKGGVNIVGATSASYSATTSGSYTVQITFNGCSATSLATVVTVNSSVAASVSISASPSNTICAGSSVTFTATPTNGGASPAYQWQNNGANIVGATSVTYTSSSLTNGNLIKVIMTSNANCATGSPATSNTITMVVNPTLTASVNISASPSNTICAGSSVTFTATPTNGGASPTYQWQNNGANIVGATSVTYTSSSLTNGNLIKVIMTSNASPCLTGSPATSNTITMVVNPVLTASVVIGRSPTGAICSGTSVTFTATPTNGGASPAYQWTKGGVNIAGATSSTYTSSTLANGNVIRVQMISNAACVSASPVLSNTITMVVNACSATLNVRAFLEGYYIGSGQMSPVLQNSGVSGNSLLTDSVTIELHNSASPYAIVNTKKVVLQTTGWSAQLLPAALLGGSYYIAILSRNGVETWSKNPVLIESVTNFDFTTP